jgi:tryptophan 2,3-dioxygenase
MPDTYQALEAALRAPGLYDDAIALARRGYSVGENALPRGWSRLYEAEPRVQSARREVNSSLSVSHEPYQLAEALVDLAERFKLRRLRHFTTVERLIGSKPSTGGTDGVSWLRHVTTHSFFPELCNLGTTL